MFPIQQKIKELQNTYQKAVEELQQRAAKVAMQEKALQAAQSALDEQRGAVKALQAVMIEVQKMLQPVKKDESPPAENGGPALEPPEIDKVVNRVEKVLQGPNGG